MRAWKWVAVAAVAMFGVCFTVARIAYAAEFTCTIPWSGDTDCKIPKFTIHAQETLTVKVTSVKVQGKDLGEPAHIKILDVNNNNTVLAELVIMASNSASYKNDRKETDQTVQLRVNVDKWATVDVQGSYTVSK